MQSPLPAPTAEGTFAKTPLSHLLVYALERRLSGTFELSAGEASATMLTIEGHPAKIRTQERVHLLGDLMVELRHIDETTLATALSRMKDAPKLLGQILIELAAADEAKIEACLRAQTERKLEHLFGLAAETTYAYFDGHDALESYGGAPSPIDPWPALWRGVKQSPAWDHVDVAMQRMGASAARLLPTAQADRFEFNGAEATAIEFLRQKPRRVIDLVNAKILGPSNAQLLVYCLIITKQVDLVAAPSSPSSAAIPVAPPSSGQAFARVQLQAKSIVRSPLIVEELPTAKSGMDDRRSSPVPKPPDSSPSNVPLIHDGGVPVAAPVAPSVTPPPARTPAIAPPPAASPAPAPKRPPSSASMPAALTGEQNALKTKIIERANQISSQDYFQMLGLPRDATPDAVQKAFLQQVKVWHPDRLPAALVDVKEACNRVFSHLTEAQATLTDDAKREQYMRLLKDGGATPDDQAKIQAVLEAATEFQKAEICMKRNDVAQAYELARKAHRLDPEQVDYLVLVTWIESQRPDAQSKDKTIEKIAVFDRCLAAKPNCERAYFYRGMLYKRVEDTARAVRDFKRASELNPRNLDAVREVRVFNMRTGGHKPAQVPAEGGRRSSKPPPPPDKLSGLFGKLFKK